MTPFNARESFAYYRARAVSFRKAASEETDPYTAGLLSESAERYEGKAAAVFEAIVDALARKS